MDLFGIRFGFQIEELNGEKKRNREKLMRYIQARVKIKERAAAKQTTTIHSEMTESILIVVIAK